MKSIRLLLRATRFPYIVASLVPAGIGASLAQKQMALFSPLLLAITMVGIGSAHLAVNLFNDFFDYKCGVDYPHPPKQFHGGSQIIQEGLMSEQTVFILGCKMGIIAVLCGLILGAFSGAAVLWFALGGGLLGFFYSAPPFLLSWRGLGEIATGICFGPLAVCGSFYVQTRYVSPDSFIISLVPGLLITSLLLVNQYPDRITDRNAGKHTLTVRMGPWNSFYLLCSLISVAYLLLALRSMISNWEFSYLAMAGFLPAIGALFWIYRSLRGANTNSTIPGALILLGFTCTGIVLIWGRV